MAQTGKKETREKAAQTTKCDRGPIDPKDDPRPQGIQGPRGERGEQGIHGDKGEPVEKGEQGVQGPQSEEGETPVVTVAENTPMSYKLNFKTTGQDVTAPNLFAPYSGYHADLSTTGSILSIPLKSLVLTYQGISSTTVRISIVPESAGASVITDMRRTTIYNSNTIETQTIYNTAISACRVIDDIVYSQLQAPTVSD